MFPASVHCAVGFLHPDVVKMPPGKGMTPSSLSNLAINLSSSLLLVDIYALQKKLDL